MASVSNTFSMQEESGSTNSSDSKRKRRNQRDRARRASETAAQKEELLRKHRVRDRAKRAAETEDQRAARLVRLSANQSERLSVESERLSVETEEQRTTRLAKYFTDSSFLFFTGLSSVTIPSTTALELSFTSDTSKCQAFSCKPSSHRTHT